MAVKKKCKVCHCTQVNKLFVQIQVDTDIWQRQVPHEFTIDVQCTVGKSKSRVTTCRVL